MVDESRHQRRYGRLSESPGSDDGDVSLASSFNPSSSDHRPRHSRKQNIRELREESDYNPEPYSTRPARDRSRYGLNPNGSYEHKSSSSRSESDEGDDESSSDASSDSDISLPKRAPRSSGRTRGRKVNYSNAFKDLSDSDDEQTYRSQNGRSMDNPNRGSSASFANRNQPSLLQKPRGPLIRTCGKAPESLVRPTAPRPVEMSDEESDGPQPDNSSNGSSEESRPVQATAYATTAEEAETDVIEEVLTQAVRRVGATGNTTTLYNCRLEHDPNEGFDPEKEKGEMQYLIKWRHWSHIHSTWETEASLTSPDRGCSVDGMKRLFAFQQKMKEREVRESVASRDELENMLYEAERDELILSEKMEVERIVAHSRDQRNEIDYLCKWRRLDYRACSWESGRVVNLIFPAAVEDYKRRCNATTLPNLQHMALKQRPRFVRMLEQPSYLGVGNPDLQLRDYQLKGLNWIAHAWTRGNSVILADEMGLGKTVQAVSFLSYLFHEHSIYGPFLIVVPLSTISNWQSELELWAPDLNLIVYTGDVTSRTLIRENEWHKNGVRRNLKFNVCMTSYEILLKDRSWLGQVPWAALVVDEAHRLKNDDSQLYKALFAFNTNTRLLITGTPLQNSLKELWSLLHFLMPTVFESWEDFEEDYSLHGHASSADGYEAITRLHRTLEPYLLRRVKKDVEQSLPAKVERILKVEMSKRQATLYRLILTRNYEGLLKVTRGHKTSFCNIVMELKKCCNHSNLIDPLNNNEPYRTNSEILRDLIRGSGKLMLLDKLLQKLRPQGHRVLIFSQMVRMLDIIERYLQLRGWGFQRLDGSIKGELRKQALDHFNAEGSTDFCFLLSTRAGGLGINLATADTVVIFDSDWNPQNDLQAQARCHRIGQTKQVSVYRLVVKDSVEEKIIESATRKMLLDHLVIQRMETGGNRRADTKGQVLTEILRHGAENIFKQSEEEMGEAEVDIDDILNNAETRNAEAEEDPYNPTNVLLSTFNVVTLDKLEQDDVKPVQVDSSGKSVKSWSEIIPEDLRESVKQAQNQEALLDLELGPRRRKPVKSYQAGEGKFESSESDDSGNDKKPQLSDKEIRALMKAVKRFARPLERIEAIAADAELPNFTNEEVKEIVAAIVNGCKSVVESGPDDQEEKSKSKGPVYYYGKVAIQAKPLLANIEQLDVLHEALSGMPSKEDRLKYELPFAPKHTNWPNQWNAVDDAHLLVGVYEHGYDNWEVIKLDADLGLGSKLLPVASNERPQASHVRARVDYLLKALKKHHDKAGFDKPRRHHKASGRKHHGRHSYHKSSEESSRHGIKPKSDEFVESEGDSSSDSDSEKPSSRPTPIPPLKIKTSHKRHLKVENGDGSPVTKKAKVTEERAKYEPVHYTANVNSTSFTEQDEEDFRKMQGPIFQKCKVGFRSLKSLLKQMEEMETRGVTDQDTYDDVIFRVGEHIRGLVRPLTDREERRVWRRYYWMFVQFFSKMDEHALETAYAQERKKRALEEKDPVRRKENDNDRDHHERSHHHHRRHHKRHREGEEGESRDRGSREALPEGDRASSSHWDDKRGHSHHRHGDRADYRYHTSSSGFSNSTDRSSKLRPGRADWSSRNDNDDRFNNAFNRPTTSYSDAFNNPELYNSRGGHDDRNFNMTESSIPPPYSSSSSVKPPASSHYSWQGYKASAQSLAMSGSSIIPPPLDSVPSTSSARDPRLWNNRQ